MSIKSFHTFSQEVFESTLLSEIGDASAKPYRLKYDRLDLDYRVSKFRVENEDFDADDPKRNWEEIDMKIRTSVDDDGMLHISFGKELGIFLGNDTLDIGLKYLLRIMSTILEHVKEHIEDYNFARSDTPLKGLSFTSSHLKGGRGTSRGVEQRKKLYKAYIEKNIRKIYPRAKVIDSGEKITVIFNPK